MLSFTILSIDRKKIVKTSAMGKIGKKCAAERKRIQYLVMWFFAGIFYCIFIAGYDVYRFCKLLMMH